MKIIEPKVELWQQGDDSKAHFVMVFYVILLFLK